MTMRRFTDPLPVTVSLGRQVTVRLSLPSKLPPVYVASPGYVTVSPVGGVSVTRKLARFGFVPRNVMSVHVGVERGTLAAAVFCTTAAPVDGSTGSSPVTVWLPLGPEQTTFFVLRS